MNDHLVAYGTSYNSRILLGTARYPSPSHLENAARAAEPALVTVALRRQLRGGSAFGESFWNILRSLGRPFLPNTAGCNTVNDAVNTAMMAREVFDTDLIKLEVIGDELSLQPDPFGLVKATEELIRRGFKVFPYCTEDLVLCRRLLDAGCEVLMPWASPIGTGQGAAESESAARASRAPSPCAAHRRCRPWIAIACLPGHGVGLRRHPYQYGGVAGG